MKVLFVTNIPSPYRVDFFNELGKYCELTVLFEKKSSDERDGSWNDYRFDSFNGVFLDGRSISVDMSYCPTVINYIRGRKWDFIICSDFLSPTGMKLVSYLKRHRIPYALESDGGFVRNDNIIKKFIKSRSIKGASWYLSTSTSHDDYYISYGADKHKIIRYPFSSVRDKDILEKPLTALEKSEIRKALGITEQFAVLAVGQFIPRKGFDVLLEAAKSIHGDIGLYFVGGSPTEEYLRLKERYNLENVHFVGFRKPEFLREYYRACDIFVLPTREDIWGLVINEAFANALPVITTDRCLAGVQMIDDGINGYIVPPENPAALSEIIHLLYEDRKLCDRISINNIEKAHNYTIETMVQFHNELFQKTMKGFNDE